MYISEKCYPGMWNSFAKYYLAFAIILILPLNGKASECAFTYQEQPSYTVYIVQDFWHTGIILKTDEVNPEIWPEIKNYRHRTYVDVGWGDEKFYQAPGFPVHLAARAVLWPTGSAMQIFAFNTALRASYGEKSRILRLPMSPEQFEALSRFISESYKRDEEGNIQASTVYGEARHFFLATRKYHLFRTCNTWVAMAFRESGLKVRSFMVLNANQLFRQLSRLPGAEFID